MNLHTAVLSPVLLLRPATVHPWRFCVTSIRTSPRAAISKGRYIKAFDPALLAAMKRMRASVNVLKSSPAIVQQTN
jgi:hypothetical protein